MKTRLDAILDRALTITLLCIPGSATPPELPSPEKGDDEIQRGLPEAYDAIGNRLRTEIVMPETRKRLFGTVAIMGIKKLMPRYKYEPRFQLLSLMSRGFLACARAFRHTEYYRDQRERHGTWLATFKVGRYIRLLKSVRTEGLKFNTDTRENLPVMFCAKDVYFRMDGAHRASVARFLELETMPVVVVTPEDVLSLQHLPDDIRAFVATLDPPDTDAFQPI